VYDFIINKQILNKLTKGTNIYCYLTNHEKFWTLTQTLTLRTICYDI